MTSDQFLMTNQAPTSSGAKVRRELAASCKLLAADCLALALFACLAVSFTGCKGALSPERVRGTLNCFPMTVGSTWTWSVAVTVPDSLGNPQTYYDTMSWQAVAHAELPGGIPAVAFEQTINGYTATDTSWYAVVDSRVLVFYYPEDDEPDTLLVLPLWEDKSWRFYGDDSTWQDVMRAVGCEDVGVPAGWYPDCWKVEESQTGTETRYYTWFAADIGLVHGHAEFTESGYTYTYDIALESVTIAPEP